MRTDNLKRGDIVEVNRGGRLFFALVTDTATLAIRPLCKGISYRSATPRQVVGIYRRAKGSRIPGFSGEAVA